MSEFTIKSNDAKMVMRIERDRIWVDPTVEVDEAAQKVLAALSTHLGKWADEIEAKAHESLRQQLELNKREHIEMQEEIERLRKIEAAARKALDHESRGSAALQALDAALSGER